MGRKIPIRNPLPFGLQYFALLGGAVLLQAGFCLCFIGAFLRVFRFGGMKTACPEFYYFSISALIIGLLLCIPLFIGAAIRWIRGARFSLAELVCLVLSLGIALSYVMGGMLTRSSMASWFIVAVYGMFFDVSNMTMGGNDTMNACVYGACILSILLFTIPLCGRLPENPRVARYLAIALAIVLATGFGSPGWAQAFGAISAGAILFYGVANREAFSALFAKQAKPKVQVEGKKLLPAKA
jgi:hypothetical protein